MHYIDEATLLAFSDKRAEISAAEGKADAFARSQMDPVAARHAALQEGQYRLGDTPALDAFVTSTEWRQAKDQHTFDLRYYARESAETEHKLNDLRAEHSGLTSTVVKLKRQHSAMVLAALDDAVARRTKEAAEIAHVRQSLLNRIPRDQWHLVVPDATDGPPLYQVQGGGYADLSFFQVRLTCDGFGPDKSSALVAELELL